MARLSGGRLRAHSSSLRCPTPSGFLCAVATRAPLPVGGCLADPTFLGDRQCRGPYQQRPWVLLSAGDPESREPRGEKSQGRESCDGVEALKTTDDVWRGKTGLFHVEVRCLCEVATRRAKRRRERTSVCVSTDG